MSSEQNGFVSGVIKGVFFAIIVSLVCLLIFAIVVKTAYLGNNVIKAVNQFIKIISVFLACTFCLKNRAGLIGGGLVGLFSSLIIYLLFSLFFGRMSFGFSFIIELVFMLVVGSISGIISVNLKK